MTVALYGSVARNQDSEGSGVDFYIGHFVFGDSPLPHVIHGFPADLLGW